VEIERNGGHGSRGFAPIVGEISWGFLGFTPILGGNLMTSRDNHIPAVHSGKCRNQGILDFSPRVLLLVSLNGDFVRVRRSFHHLLFNQHQFLPFLPRQITRYIKGRVQIMGDLVSPDHLLSIYLSSRINLVRRMKTPSHPLHSTLQILFSPNLLSSHDHVKKPPPSN